MKAVFIQLDGFGNDWAKLKQTDEDLQGLEQEIMASPERWPVMSGTGGIRKMRFAPSGKRGGKSGGCRVCYVWFPEWSIALLVVAFAKNVKENLSASEKAALKDVVEKIRKLLRSIYGN